MPEIKLAVGKVYENRFTGSSLITEIKNGWAYFCYFGLAGPDFKEEHLYFRGDPILPDPEDGKPYWSEAKTDESYIKKLQIAYSNWKPKA